MKRSVYILVFFLLTHVNIYSQESKIFGDAMELYQTKNYTAARELFLKVDHKDDIDEKLISTVKYFAADCLLKLGQLDGAIEEFENFTSVYRFSNYRDEAFYKLGTIYFEKGQYSLVRQKLLILINEYPESEYLGSSYFWVGESYVNENKFLEGEEFLLEAVSASESNRFVDHTIYALAYLYERMGKYSNAVTYYDELLAYHRESKLAPDAQLRIGVSYFYLKEYDSAVLELSDPMINKLSNAFQTEANYYLANAFFRLQEYEHAELTFREVLHKNPSRNIVREMNFGIGWINFQQQNYENAFEIFSNLAVEGSDSISAISLYWSAECERYLGRTDEAMKIYEAFQSKYSDDPLGESVKLNVGIIQFNLNNFSEAERNLVAATISDDKSVKGKAFTILGEISLEKSNFLEAEFYFSEALKISLLNQDLSNRAILGLGVSQFFQEKYDESIMNLTDLSIRVQRFEKRKVNFYLGETYFAKRNYSSALKHYHRVTEADDKLYQQALYGKSYSAFNLKDFANAAYYFGVYVNKYKNDEHLLDAKLRLADSYYGTKNFDRASKIYGEILRDYGTSLINDFALYQYAQSLFKAGDSIDAIKKLNQLQKTYPKSNYADESQYLIGWIHFQQSDFKTAINNYNALMKKYPGSSIRPIAYYSIGDSFYNLGEYDSSIVYYSKLIEEYPKTQFVFDAVSGIQYCYIANDKPDNAIEVIDNYLLLYPDTEYSDKVLMKKGEIYYSLGDYEKAISGYKEVLNMYPNSELIPEAHYWIGKSAVMLENFDEAEYNFKLIVADNLFSKYGIDAVIELGKVYAVNEDYESELQLYNSVYNKISESDRGQEILFLKGKASLNKNDISGAYNSFNEIIKFYDKTLFSAKAKIEIGLLELEADRFENAEMLFRELSQFRLDDIGAEAQYLLGVVLFEQKNYNDAISAFVRVRTVFPTYDEWYTKSLIMLGDCYVKLSDKKRAREMYRAVIKRHPRDEYGKEAKAKLNRI